MKHKHVFMIVACVAALAAVCVDAYGVTLKLDQVRQRYPWNGLVDIDYTVADASSVGLDDNLEVLMVDKAVTPAVTNRALTFLQAPLPMTDGKHRITWDANADGVTNRTDQAEFHVKVVHYAAAYMVVDVSAGTGSDVIYPVDFLNGEPEGGVKQDKYMENKIVFRRIRPGSYIAGSPSDEASRDNYTEAGLPKADVRERQHRVMISKTLYVGIFEVTQAQYEKVMGSNPSMWTGSHRPVEAMTYTDLRGNGWPQTTAPAAGSFMDRLNKRCKSKDEHGEYTVDVKGFDLPTEFQWEYACRAGSTEAFYSTDGFDNTDSVAQKNQLELIGLYKDNASKGVHPAVSGVYKTTDVGAFQSNAWGLYDMTGNVFEWCCDWFQADVVSLKQVVDPKGADSGYNNIRRIARGGGYNCPVGWARVAVREGYDFNQGNGSIGFRIFRSLP